MVCFRSGDVLSFLGDVLRYSRRVDFPCKSTVLRLTSLVTSRSRNRPANSAGHAIRFYGECIGKVRCYESGIRYPAESSLQTGSNHASHTHSGGLRPMCKSGISAGSGFANCASLLVWLREQVGSNQFDISKLPSNTSYPSDGSKALPVPEPVILIPWKRPVPSALTILDENRLP
jgi:hypothetical protein